MDFPIEEQESPNSQVPLVPPPSHQTTTTTTTGTPGTGTSSLSSSGRPSVPPPFPPTFDQGHGHLPGEIAGISSHFEDDLMREFDQKHSNLSSFLDDRVSDLTSTSGQKTSGSPPGVEVEKQQKEKETEQVVPSPDPFEISSSSMETSNLPSYGSHYPEATDIFHDNEYEIVRQHQEKPVGDVISGGADFGFGGVTGKTAGESLFDVDDIDKNKEMAKTEFGAQGGATTTVSPGTGAGDQGQGHSQSQEKLLDEHEQLMGQFERVSPNMMNFGYEPTTVTQTHSSTNNQFPDLASSHSHELPHQTQTQSTFSPSASATTSLPTIFGQQPQPIIQHRGFGNADDDDDEDDFEKDSISQQSQSLGLSSKLSDSLEALKDIPRETSSFPAPVHDHYAPPTSLATGTGTGIRSGHEYLDDDFERDSISHPLSSQKLSDSLEVLKDSPDQDQQKEYRLDESLMDLEELPSSKNSLKSISPNEGAANLLDDFAEILPPPPLVGTIEADIQSEVDRQSGVGVGMAMEIGAGATDAHLENLPPSPFDMLSTESGSQSPSQSHSQSQSSAIFGMGMDELPELTQTHTTTVGQPDISNSSIPNLSEVTTTQTTTSISDKDQDPQVTIAESQIHGYLPDVATTATPASAPVPDSTYAFPLTPEDEEIPPPIPPHQNLGVSSSPPKFTTPHDNEIEKVIEKEQSFGSESQSRGKTEGHEKQPEIQDVLNPFENASVKSSDLGIDLASKYEQEDDHLMEASRDSSPSPPPIPPHRQQPLPPPPQTEMETDDGKDDFQDTGTNNLMTTSMLMSSTLEEVIQPRFYESEDSSTKTDAPLLDAESKDHQSITEDLEDLLPKETEKEPVLASEPPPVIQEAHPKEESVNENETAPLEFEFSMAEAEAPEIDFEKDSILKEAESLVSEILETAAEPKEFKESQESHFQKSYEGQPIYELKVDEPTEKHKVDEDEPIVEPEPQVETETKTSVKEVKPVPVASKSTSYQNQEPIEISEEVEKILNTFNPRAWFQPEKLHPTVGELVYWRDPKKSGIVFGALLVILLALTSLSLISVVAYTSLTVLTGTLAFRVYKSVLQAVQKTQDGHPFKEYLDLDLTVSNEKAQEVSTAVTNYFNATAAKLRSLFLVEDIVESAKFGVALYLLTYIGAWFNGLTLVILGLIALFAAPKVYETNKAIIDQYLDLVQAKISEITTKITTAVPFLAKKEKPQ